MHLINLYFGNHFKNESTKTSCNMGQFPKIPTGIFRASNVIACLGLVNLS